MISLPTCNQSHLKDDLWIGFKLQSDKEIPKIPSFLVQILRIHMQINWFESIQMGSELLVDGFIPSYSIPLTNLVHTFFRHE